MTALLSSCHPSESESESLLNTIAQGHFIAFPHYFSPIQRDNTHVHTETSCRFHYLLALQSYAFAASTNKPYTINSML